MARKPQPEKMRIIFLVCQDINNWVVAGGEDLSVDLNLPEGGRGATGL